MNEPMQRAGGLARELAFAAVLVAIGVLGRWFDHAPNATPIAATALFAGWVLRNRGLAVLVPVAALAISDVFFRGGYAPGVMAAVYGTFGATTLLGRSLGGRWHAARVVGGSLAASTAFYVVSNLAVWLAGGLGYTRDWSGLVLCYERALPFFENTLRGDLFWCGVLFGGAASCPIVARAISLGARRCRTNAQSARQAVTVPARDNSPIRPSPATAA